MDDIQILVYLLIVGFGLFSRFLKAKKKKNASPPQPSQRDSSPKQPKVSFDELLKEFTGESEKYEEEPELVIEHQAEVVKPAAYQYDDDQIQQRYQESLQSAQSLESEAEEKDDRHTGDFIHFRGYDQFEQEEVESEYLTFLREEDGPKKAIILSEILNRRY